MGKDSVIVTCDKCGTKNRIPRVRMQESPLCGKCHEVIAVGTYYDQPVTISDYTFAEEVTSYPGPVLVDCWAPWCGPCRMVGPVLDQLASEYAGRIKIAKLNVDENPRTATQHAIQSIPTLLLFNQGKKVGQLVGAQPRAAIEKQLKAVL